MQRGRLFSGIKLINIGRHIHITLKDEHFRCRNNFIALRTESHWFVMYYAIQCCHDAIDVLHWHSSEETKL